MYDILLRKQQLWWLGDGVQDPPALIAMGRHLSPYDRLAGRLPQTLLVDQS